jgi:hypothetical protein
MSNASAMVFSRRVQNVGKLPVAEKAQQGEPFFADPFGLREMLKEGSECERIVSLED